ncbi:MAG: cytochrome c3 family protein [Bryobacteraceae bacterium]
MDTLLVILAATAGAALAAPEYVGAAACRACHGAQYATQSVSQHARALRPILQTDIPERIAEQPLRERSGVVFNYAREAGGLAVTTAKGKQRVTALLEWAFGSGAQAVTPVGRYKGAFFEHRISYYRAPDRAARTIGHSGTPSVSAEAALGIRQDAATITRCFACHATGVREGPELSDMTPGVTCERCHGPGSEHVRRAENAKMQRTAAVSLCAECHRMPGGSGREPELRDPASVRFQLVGLSASACYRESGRLTCVSCHDPHQDAVRTAGPYVAVCAGCHTAPAKGAGCGRSAKQDCLPCHMRKSTPLPYLTFTDHRIRVY